MRLLQLNQNGSEETALDFHPAVTVVSGLGASGREQVLHAVAALPAGKDPGCGGLLEAHGVMLDLDPATLAMLDMHLDLDVLIRRADLPVGGGVPSDATGSSAVARMTTEQFLREAPDGRYPELDTARQRLADARESLAVLVDAAARSKASVEQARARRERAEAALEEAQALRAGQIDRVPDAMDEDQLSARRAELEADVEALRAELARIERGIEELGGIDTRPIEVLLDAIRNPVVVEWVPSERASELADEFEALQSAVTGLEEGLERRGLGTASAMQRLEDARTELAAAEKGMAKPELSPDDVAELEAAHEEVLEAERRASGRSKRNQKRLDEALERQQAVLDRVGFPTWSAYVMGAGLLAIDPVAEQRLERARFELERAESHWADITAMIEADPEHGALLDRLEAVYLEAYDLLGGQEPDDLATALRDLQVPRHEVAIDELVDALAYQLELVGLDLGADPTVDFAVLAAEAFLEESAGINDRVAQLRGDREAILPVLNRAEYALERTIETQERDEPLIDLTDGATDGAVPDGELADTDAAIPAGPSDEEMAALEAELDQAREDEHDHNDALEAREALVGAATQVEAVAASRLMKLAADLAAAEGGEGTDRPESEPAFDVAPGDAEGEAGAEAVEFYLLARLAALRNVSYAGSVPMVLDDALAGLPPDEVRSLLTKLERMAESVQVIYLGDDPVVVDWAVEMGFRRAAVVTAPPAFA